MPTKQSIQETFQTNTLASRPGFENFDNWEATVPTAGAAKMQTSRPANSQSAGPLQRFE